MKKAVYSSKYLALLLVGLALSGCKKDPVAPPPPPEVGEMQAFFSGYLAGNTAGYGKSAAIELADIEKERSSTWEAWKLANNGFTEEKLIPLQPLSQANTGSWLLPASLEPNATMPFYWGSKGSASAGGYSLFLYVHGSGDKNSEWAAGLNLGKAFNDTPSVYFIPQIPNTNYYRWYLKSKQFAWEKLLRLAFVAGEINPNKVYFFGISEGGYGSQRLASFYADYLAGAGPMASGEPLKNAPVENCRNTAFSLRTGANDTGFGRNTLTQYAKDEFDRFEAASPGSFVHNIQLIAGQGHGIDYSQTTPWLKQYTRNPYPKRVTWENFEMDGRYRSGFHNLYVSQRSNDNGSARTYYDLSIAGNDLTLTVQLVTYQTIETHPTGVELKFAKTYTTATKGKITVYLSPELVDLSKEITLTVNGKQAFKGMVEPDRKHLVNSCAAFFDPARLYPAAIEVDLSQLQ